MLEDTSECKSSEELRASLEAFNDNVDSETRKQCIILSMDVKALYPSM